MILFKHLWWYILDNLNKMWSLYSSCGDWKTWVCKLEHYKSKEKDIPLYHQTYIKYFRHHGTQQYNFLHTMTAYITYKTHHHHSHRCIYINFFRLLYVLIIEPKFHSFACQIPFHPHRTQQTNTCQDEKFHAIPNSLAFISKNFIGNTYVCTMFIYHL